MILKCIGHKTGFMTWEKLILASLSLKKINKAVEQVSVCKIKYWQIQHLTPGTKLCQEE
jgi:hypothetical protein